MLNKLNIDNENIEHINDENINELEEQSKIKRVRVRPKVTRTGLRPRKLHNVTPIIEEEKPEVNTATLEEEVLISEIPIDQALNGPSSNECYKAIATEVSSILKNKTWDLVDRNNVGQVIGSRVVLTNKYNSAVVLERRKARLVALGFLQRPGVHFDQTYAPVARLSSVRFNNCNICSL